MTAVFFDPLISADKSGRLVRYQVITEDFRRSLEDFYQAFEPKGVYQGLPPVEPEARSLWLKRLLDNWVNLGAFYQDNLVGHAALEGLGAEASSEFLIYVSPKFQNCGIGTALTGYAADMAKSCRCRQVWLMVQSSNLRAIRVYRKIGFSFTGPFENEREMVLTLRNG